MANRALNVRLNIGPPAVLGAFSRLGITSFGGNTAAWLYRDVVERRRWIDDAAFLSGLALRA